MRYFVYSEQLFEMGLIYFNSKNFYCFYQMNWVLTHSWLRFTAMTQICIKVIWFPDVNTPNPDKKSIMMYVMCLFQSLPHSSEDVADLESVASEPTTPVTNNPPEVTHFFGTLHMFTRSHKQLSLNTILQRKLNYLASAVDIIAAFDMMCYKYNSCLFKLRAFILTIKWNIQIVELSNKPCVCSPQSYYLWLMV